VTTNVAASIHQRLLNYARAKGRPFNEVLQYFALERLLYRLGRSPYRDRFVLKGALMLSAWNSVYARPTRDIGLLGWLANRPEVVVPAIAEICLQTAGVDGLRFDKDSIASEPITEAAQYAGMRVRFTGCLGTARIPMRLDIGFGDALVPGPMPIQLPTILGMSAPEILGYSRESAIAEKVQIMVRLGEVNSRMKDFYDVWALASQFSFDGQTLSRAFQATFQQRRTALDAEPVAFDGSFTEDPDKQVQWRAFVQRLHLDAAPATLYQSAQTVAALSRPVMQALADGSRFDLRWPSGGPWVEAQE